MDLYIYLPKNINVIGVILCVQPILQLKIISGRNTSNIPSTNKNSVTKMVKLIKDRRIREKKYWGDGFIKFKLLLVLLCVLVIEYLLWIAYTIQILHLLHNIEARVISHE